MKPKILAFFIIFLALPGCLGGPGKPAELHGALSKSFKIIDAHEHVASIKCVPKLLGAMEGTGVSAMMLVASPKELLGDVQDSKKGFTDPDANNEEILEIQKRHPGVFFGFATFAPDDIDMLEKLKGFIERGGTGLKLYNGHFDFYGRFKIPLCAPHMMKVFEYCENNRIPIVFHANARLYWPELKRLLDAHPNLVVNLPHFAMSLITPARIRELFDNYPSVYADVSLGYFEYAYPSLEFISSRAQAMRALIKRYKTRFLFGADMVLTENPLEDESYISRMILAYRRLLEKDRYTSILIEQFFINLGETDIEEIRHLRGLNLDEDTLRHIYELNPRRFLGIKQD